MARKRTLTPDEERLWQHVMKDTVPLNEALASQKPAPPPFKGSLSKKARRSGQQQAPIAHQAPNQVPNQVQAAPRALAPSWTPPKIKGGEDLDNLDRKSRQRVLRGKIEVDAKIDLHGMRQSQAHEALISRVYRARADGRRVLLVVTGKGAAREARNDGSQPFWARGGGVLKASVPLWLAQEPLRSMIFSVQQAHQRHGGSGALYVFLKRAR